MVYIVQSYLLKSVNSILAVTAVNLPYSIDYDTEVLVESDNAKITLSLSNFAVSTHSSIRRWRLAALIQLFLAFAIFISVCSIFYFAIHSWLKFLPITIGLILLVVAYFAVDRRFQELTKTLESFCKTKDI